MMTSVAGAWRGRGAGGSQPQGAVERAARLGCSRRAAGRGKQRASQISTLHLYRGHGSGAMARRGCWPSLCSTGGGARAVLAQASRWLRPLSLQAGKGEALLVAEILSVDAHPKTNQLRVITLDIGGIDTIEVRFLSKPGAG